MRPPPTHSQDTRGWTTTPITASPPAGDGAETSVRYTSSTGPTLTEGVPTAWVAKGNSDRAGRMTRLPSTRTLASRASRLA